MKRHIVFTVLFAIFITRNVEAAGKSVSIQNNTSSNITKIYASRAGANNWHLLGQIFLRPGYSVTANIKEKSSLCAYDFKFVFDTGAQFVQQFVNVCTGYSLIITENIAPQGLGGQATPPVNAIPFDLNNPLEGLPLIDNDPRLTPSRSYNEEYIRSQQQKSDRYSCEANCLRKCSTICSAGPSSSYSYCMTNCRAEEDACKARCR